MRIPSQKNQISTRGFTLIELLVVIAIIAILAALLTTAATSAQNTAKKTTAKNQCVQIATAITAYETEYGKLPGFSGNSLSNNNLAMLLSSDTVNNPRGIPFIDVSAWKPGKGGTNAQGFCDPWSNVYSVALDTNYTNVISVPPDATNSTYTTITKHIGVWTIPTIGSKKFLINSWD